MYLFLKILYSFTNDFPARLGQSPPCDPSLAGQAERKVDKISGFNPR